ncbi:hypothetical protein [Streptomyces asiaticus]|uniref:hypothetical protein n=1 Tax=Streptomyces asiaticus TaxID=114695 RepID=UPI003F677531
MPCELWRPSRKKRRKEATLRAALLEEAVKELADTLETHDTAKEVAASFVCSEADALAKVLVAAGHREVAIAWLEGHARGDENWESHFDIDIAEYVDSLIRGGVGDP